MTYNAGNGESRQVCPLYSAAAFQPIVLSLSLPLSPPGRDWWQVLKGINVVYTEMNSGLDTAEGPFTHGVYYDGVQVITNAERASLNHTPGDNARNVTLLWAFESVNKVIQR